MALITSRIQFPDPDSPPSFLISVPSESRKAQLKWLAFFSLNCLFSDLITDERSEESINEVPQAKNRLCFSETHIPETVSFRVRAVPMRNLLLETCDTLVRRLGKYTNMKSYCKVLFKSKKLFTSKSI